MATQRARVLIDDATVGIKSGQLVEADAKVIKALSGNGLVDPDKDAVAYAESIGAEVVSIGAADSEQKQAPDA